MKTRVLILVGGRSGEHEVSLISGKHIIAALDRNRFEPLLLVIQKDGVMTVVEETALEQLSNNPKEVKTPIGENAFIRPYGAFDSIEPAIIVNGKEMKFDVAFPVLHGPGGEDGSIQGLFELAQIPVVGCDVKASAICMDKGTTKKLCVQAGIPVVPFREVYREEKEDFFKTFSTHVSFPLFVKAAHLGSSIGVYKAKNFDELKKAVNNALELDTKILIEQAIVGREIEIAVLGRRGHLRISPAAEIRCVKADFYSYDAKYVVEDAAELLVPTELLNSELQQVQELAKRIFECLECYGMSRIDFFLTKDGEFLLNEVNTIPGFTPISMYPKLMQLTGLSYSNLISELIDLAMKR